MSSHEHARPGSPAFAARASRVVVRRRASASAAPSARSTSAEPRGARRRRRHDEAEDDGRRPRRHDAAGPRSLPGGLAVSERRLHARARPTAPPAGGDRAARVHDRRARTARRSPTYDVEHEKQLHLIVVRRDLTGFQHVHPTLAADGTWTVAARP